MQSDKVAKAFRSNLWSELWNSNVRVGKINLKTPWRVYFIRHASNSVSKNVWYMSKPTTPNLTQKKMVIAYRKHGLRLCLSEALPTMATCASPRWNPNFCVSQTMFTRVCLQTHPWVPTSNVKGNTDPPLYLKAENEVAFTHIHPVAEKVKPKQIKLIFPIIPVMETDDHKMQISIGTLLIFLFFLPPLPLFTLTTWIMTR